MCYALHFKKIIDSIVGFVKFDKFSHPQKLYQAMKPLSKEIIVSFADSNFTTAIPVNDSNTTLHELFKKNGLEARDGSFRYICDNEGNMINHVQAFKCPQKVVVQNPKNVYQVWIDQSSNNYMSETYVSESTQILLLNAKQNEFSEIYVTPWKCNDKHIAYKFRPISPFYHKRDIVFLKVPQHGEYGSIFNPSTGVVNFQIKLDMNPAELSKIRGFWTAWELIDDKFSARRREDILPIPESVVASNRKNKKTRYKKGQSVNFQNLECISDHPRLYSLDRSSTGSILIAGPSDISHLSNNFHAKVVANSFDSRPAYANLNGFRWGRTYFVKIPKKGNEIKIFNDVENTNFTFTLRENEDYKLEDFRERWVIVSVRKRRTKQGITRRYADIQGVPSQIL
jgi:hypothetical protein